MPRRKRVIALISSRDAGGTSLYLTRNAFVIIWRTETDADSHSFSCR